MKKYITLILTILCLTTCKDQAVFPNSELQTESDTDYIIFGHFYGFCLGERCIEIFKLTNTSLLEDTNDFYPSSQEAYDGAYVSVEQSKFNKLKDIKFEIPDELLNETEKVIGTPDAADGGGIYIELPDGRYWLLDMNEYYLPEYLHPLREQIRAAIAKISE
ncbi:hypothetical protein SAMN04488029_1419 [Reichenbachiella faecimaris]|uniref:Uncharacterized protein n=1 Tax=Reichenbachiella faecimaris TaxID=692418 RepID=A0A1W2G8P4_REIFA|nr:hypothetical protein [Reichenbachiella faecimaris]SMD33055.1 hypothetical protein SAMN04488029_1419 [Reichenbachiella faecimaris]